MKLYGFPQTRTNRVRWMLEEIGVPYEFILVDVRVGAHKKPEHIALHPHGSVPVLVDGEDTIIESCAAVLYLADKFADRGLAPPLDQRAAYYQWIVYASATMDEPGIQTLFHTRFLPPERRDPQVVERHRGTLETIIRHLAAGLSGRSYLLGEQFSAADVTVGYAVNILDVLGLVRGEPTVAAYLDRLRERPAFRRTYSG